jgi:uncharacterized protein YjbI with pentapeptide repeats
MMTTQLANSTVRILDSDQEPVGTGVLVSDKHVLTCAHVVNQACNEDSPDCTQSEIELDFPLVASGKLIKASVVCWWFDEDVAGLELSAPPPVDLHPVPLKSAEGLRGQRVDAFGFPKGYDDGQWVEGVISGRTGKGRLQIRTKDPQFDFIVRGFSGGPIWAEDQSGIIGITVESDEEQTAYCIPTKILTSLWADLAIWSKPACPYRGLSAFREEDTDVFFGRETFTSHLVESVRQKLLVAVLGPSGSGKSSIVFAGLIPALRQAKEQWLITSFRPGSDPFEALAARLLPLYETEVNKTDQMVQVLKLAAYMREGDLSLSHIVRNIFEARPQVEHFLLVADQFEEIYTLTQDAEIHHQFLDLLLTAVDTNISAVATKLHLVLTLRSAFLDQALVYAPFCDALQRNIELVGPMNPNELRTVIEKPADLQGVTFEDGLVDRILDDVRDEPGNLPLLEFALTALWEQQTGIELNHNTYKAIGRIAGALSGHAEKVFAGLSKTEQNQARKVFMRLVQPGEETPDTRRLAHRDELTEADWALVQKLALADTRLVVTDRDPDEGEITVEVVHEALISEWGRLRGWIDKNRAFLNWLKRLRFSVKQWQDTERDEKALLGGTLLAEAEGWLDERKDELGLVEHDFIQASIRLREEEQRQKLIFEILTRGAVGRDLSEADLREATLRGANLSGANLNRADLSKANLREATLSEADLRGANIREADLNGANLRRTKIDNTTQIDGKWRLVWKIVNQETTGEDLSKANLSGADLSGANLSKANLREANLNGADLSGADLSGANLRKANLREANLNGADLRGANLELAHLYEAKMDDTTQIDEQWSWVAHVNADRNSGLVVENVQNLYYGPDKNNPLACVIVYGVLAIIMLAVLLGFTAMFSNLGLPVFQQFRFLMLVATSLIVFFIMSQLMTAERFGEEATLKILRRQLVSFPSRVLDFIKSYRG